MNAVFPNQILNSNHHLSRSLSGETTSSERSHHLEVPHRDPPQCQTGCRSRRPRDSTAGGSDLRNLLRPLPLAPDPDASSASLTESCSSTSSKVVTSPLALYEDLHEKWIIRIFLILVAYLHTHHHVSFRACALLLFCFSTLIMAAIPGLLGTSDKAIPLTLTTLLSRLNLDDQFTIHPICWKCHRIFSPAILSDTLCSDCDLALFKPASRQLYRQLTGQERFARPSAHLVSPIRVLSSLLVDFLAQPDIIKELEEWKHQPPSAPGQLHNIQDGQVWKSILGPNGKPFFDPNDTSGELRLGVTFSLDW